MKEVEVEFHPEAREEYLDILQWYIARSELVAGRFQQEMTLAVQLIEVGPKQWPIFEEPFRFLRLEHFPYLPHCEEVDEGKVQVLAVAHASRRSGYWLNRRNEDWNAAQKQISRMSPFNSP